MSKKRCSLQEIRRGRYEEMDREGFRIMALVTETLPRALKKELYEIVALRTHIQYSDRDYIEKICNFLPPPRPVPLQDASLPNAFSIRSQLDRFDEMRRENRNQSMSNVVHLHRDNEAFVIDQYTASITSGTWKAPWPSMSEEERHQMLSRYLKSPEMPAECYAETRSLNYVLLEQDNEDESSACMDVFSRLSVTRTTCRF